MVQCVLRCWSYFPLVYSLKKQGLDLNSNYSSHLDITGFQGSSGCSDPSGDSDQMAVGEQDEFNLDKTASCRTADLLSCIQSVHGVGVHLSLQEKMQFPWRVRQDVLIRCVIVQHWQLLLLLSFWKKADRVTVTFTLLTSHIGYCSMMYVRLPLNIIQKLPLI